MPYIPEKVKKSVLVDSLMPYFISQGKVGDKYEYPGRLENLISLRSNRVSSDDFSLPFNADYKGEVLTALADFWAREFFNPLGIKHHLVYSQGYPGRNIIKELCKKFPGIKLECTLGVLKVTVGKYEIIFRFHIGGSVWKRYLENNGIVAGVQLPVGMRKWQKLEAPFFPLFTPSTKASVGHDVNITQAEFFEATGDAGHQLVEKLSELCKEIYKWLRKRGIVMLDTKLEASDEIICDEWFNPDTSRFVSEANLAESIEKGVEPEFMDKQPVRDFCAKIVTPFFDKDGNQIIGLKGLDPENLKHCKFVEEYDFPVEELAGELTRRYLMIFKLITGIELADYQREYLL